MRVSLMSNHRPDHIQTATPVKRISGLAHTGQTIGLPGQAIGLVIRILDIGV